MNTAVRRSFHALVGWFRRVFKSPRYVMGWDIGEDRDYWVKARIHADGTIEIIDYGVNEHNTANAAHDGRQGVPL